MATATEAIAQAVAPVVAEIAATSAVAVTRTTSRPSWYSITNKRGTDNETEIRIYEDIGLFGVSAKQFADDLEAVQAKTIHVRLNTEGGEVFDGLAIFNALRAHPATIIVHVDGLAASSGSLVAMSGDEIRMADNAFMMIHEARGGVVGEAGDMRQYAEILDKLNDTIASTYQARAGKTRKYWRDKMAEETWLNAEDAKREGLADAIDDRETAATNRFDFRIYNHAKEVPQAVRKIWGRIPPGITMLNPGEDVVQVQTNSPAPEDSQRSDPPPATNKETSAMPNESTTAAPAQNPAAGTGPAVSQGNPNPAPTITEAENRQRAMVALNAQTIEGYINQGRSAGHVEGRKAELERCKQIAEACPGRPEMALNAILANHTPESVRLAFSATVAAEERYKAQLEQRDAEVARWQNLAANGGYPGGVAAGFSGTEAEEEPQQLDAASAKVQAEREWDQKPSVRKGWSNKQNYVNVRAAELTGKLRTATATVAAGN